MSALKLTLFQFENKGYQAAREPKEAKLKPQKATDVSE
jgi:hypothetical protein